MAIWLVLLLLFSTLSLAEEVVLASEPVCPYICADEQTGELLSPPGIVFEIARDALGLAGHQLRYQMRPAARSFREVRAGQMDATVTWQANVPDFIFPEEPIVSVDLCFFSRHDSDWNYQGVESLQGKRLGIIIDDRSPSAELESYLREHQSDEMIEPAFGTEATRFNIQKLVAGRIDLMFDEKLLTQSHLQEAELEDQVRLAGCPSTGLAVFLALSPKRSNSQQLAQEFSDGIRKLKHSGRIEQIWAHYDLKAP